MEGRREKQMGGLMAKGLVKRSRKVEKRQKGGKRSRRLEKRQKGGERSKRGKR